MGHMPSQVGRHLRFGQAVMEGVAFGHGDQYACLAPALFAICRQQAASRQQAVREHIVAPQQPAVQVLALPP